MYQEEQEAQPNWESMGVEFKLSEVESPVVTTVCSDYIMGFNSQCDPAYCTVRTVTGNLKVKHSYEELKKMISHA